MRFLPFPVWKRAIAAVIVIPVLVALPVSGTSAARSSSSPGATASSGCGTSAQPGSRALAGVIDGHKRTGIIHIPTGYRKSTPVALVLNLHGSGSTAAAQERFSGMDATADRDTFIVAYPQALIPQGTGYDWNIPNVPLLGGSRVPAGAANDVRFLTQLVHTLEGRYCIRTSAVYATGISGGGRMSSQLACDASTVFAAVAPVAGLRRPTPCPTTRAVPVIAFHGTADHVDPYNGHGQAYWTYSVPTAASEWATQDRCARRPHVTTAHGYTLTTYTGCASNARVELYAITGEGHEWPGGPTMPPRITALLGPQSSAIDANDVMWAFFVAHPLS